MMTTRREFLAGAGACAATFVFGAPGAAAEKTLRVTVIEPRCMAGGAGLCVVFRTPAGKTYLFDTANGDPFGRSTANNGRDILLPWFARQGVKQIDGLIVSHYHADHFGGFLWLWNHFPIRRVFDNGYLPPTLGMTEHDLTEYRAARRALDAWGAAHPGALVEGLREGADLGWNEPDVAFDVVWPPKDRYVPALENRAGYGKGDNPFHHLLNANSNALHVRAFGKTFFITGDIQPDYVKAYMHDYLKARGKWGCDVATLPAHGTKPQEALAEFADMAPRPKTVVASLGDLPWMKQVAAQDKRVFGAAGYEAFATCLDGSFDAVFPRIRR